MTQRSPLDHSLCNWQVDDADDQLGYVNLSCTICNDRRSMPFSDKTTHDYTVLAHHEFFTYNHNRFRYAVEPKPLNGGAVRITAILRRQPSNRIAAITEFNMQPEDIITMHNDTMRAGFFRTLVYLLRAQLHEVALEATIMTNGKTA